MTAAERIRLAREARGMADPLNRLRARNAERIAAGEVEPIVGIPEPASAASVRSSVERGDALAILRTSTELEGS